MFEDVQAAGEHLVGQLHTRLPTSFEERTQMFSGVGEVQNAHRIWSITIGNGLAPLGSVCHRTHLLGLCHLAPLHLPCGEFDERGGIRQTRKI